MRMAPARPDPRTGAGSRWPGRPGGPGPTNTPSAAIPSRVIRLQHMQTWQGWKGIAPDPFVCGSVPRGPASRCRGARPDVVPNPRVQPGLIGVLVEELEPATWGHPVPDRRARRLT